MVLVHREARWDGGRAMIKYLALEGRIRIEGRKGGSCCRTVEAWRWPIAS